MGVLNVTPDSFSDGNNFFDMEKAVLRGVEMAAEGADAIDVGGESTRPGADEVDADEELRRVIPVIKALSGKIDIPISVDTRKSKIAEEAVKAGASVINDISGLRYDKAMAKVAAKYSADIIIMHSKGEPRTMQVNPAYKNLIKEMIDFFKESIAVAKGAGVRDDDIIIDPGIGFGKTVEHNLEILNRLDEFKVLHKPICVGTSRKSFIGKILGIDDPEDRLAGSLASSTAAIMNGADILRVHDVKATVQAARVADSILERRAI